MHQQTSVTIAHCNKICLNHAFNRFLLLSLKQFPFVNIINSFSPDLGKQFYELHIFNSLLLFAMYAQYV